MQGRDYCLRQFFGGLHASGVEDRPGGWRCSPEPSLRPPCRPHRSNPAWSWSRASAPRPAERHVREQWRAPRKRPASRSAPPSIGRVLMEQRQRHRLVDRAPSATVSSSTTSRARVSQAVSSSASAPHHEQGHPDHRELGRHDLVGRGRIRSWRAGRLRCRSRAQARRAGGQRRAGRDAHRAVGRCARGRWRASPSGEVEERYFVGVACASSTDASRSARRTTAAIRTRSPSTGTGPPGRSSPAWIGPVPAATLNFGLCPGAQSCLRSVPSRSTQARSRRR